MGLAGAQRRAPLADALRGRLRDPSFAVMRALASRTLLLSLPLALLPTSLAAQERGELGRQRPPLFHEAARHELGVLRVKFREGLRVRLVEGAPTDVESGAPLLDAALFGGTWRRAYDLPEATLDEWRTRASAYWGRPTVDHNLEFFYRFEPGDDHDALIGAFHQSEWVEYALPRPRAVELPSVAGALPPGNYEPQQDVLGSAPDGIGVVDVQGLPGGTGNGVNLVDLEYSFNGAHHDLPFVWTIVAGDDPFNDDNHGTAVLGQVLGVDNGYGVTGICPDAAGFFAACSSNDDGYDLEGALLTSVVLTSPGDVLLIEQQTDGPGSASDDYVPSEWNLPVYNAIQTAVGVGRVVVEAAGNGGWNLDDPIFSIGNGNHWPFLPQNDSGAILVGAGGPPDSGSDDLSRLSFSCYGSTVDLQGYGSMVTTTGYGGLYSAGGKNQWYTNGFNGTSSASPIVAGAAVLVQSIYKASGGIYMLPHDVRNILRATGTPQQSGTFPASQNIGPRPDLERAAAWARATWVDFAHFGLELATYSYPLNTFTEGVGFAGPGDTIYIKGGTTPWTGVIQQATTLNSHGGATLIGAP